MGWSQGKHHDLQPGIQKLRSKGEVPRTQFGYVNRRAVPGRKPLRSGSVLTKQEVEFGEAIKNGKQPPQVRPCCVVVSGAFTICSGCTTVAKNGVDVRDTKITKVKGLKVNGMDPVGACPDSRDGT